jgi:hypothetical protein
MAPNVPRMPPAVKHPGRICVGPSSNYYFTPHTAVPFGDLVFYLSANLGQTIDGPSTNTLSLTPGFRTHLGENWYFLGAVEVPVTTVKGFDYQVLGALMKVF